MSIEKDLTRIATALETIAQCLSAKSDNQPSKVEPVAQREQVVTNQAPVAAPPVIETAPVVPTSAAPAPAPATNPVAATPTSANPSGFAASKNVTDKQSLMGYVMEKYRALGPVKGAMIQNLLNDLSCKNINDLKPEQYDVFVEKVEAL